MAVYVDDLVDTLPAEHRWWPFDQHCHMTADTLTELHEMAVKLGLRHVWYQERARVTHCHYDLTANKRKQAVRLGAKPETSLEWFARLKAEIEASRA